MWHHDRSTAIHGRVIHSPVGSGVAGFRERRNTGDMTETPTQQSWIPHLDAATGTLPAATTTAADVYRALALAWHTSVAVTHPASVVTELGWMRLAEALHTAWAELATVVDPPAAVPFEAGTPPVTGPLDDTEQLRNALARLVRATAAALRTLAADHPPTADAALTVAGIAVELEASIEGWP
jgi:hypothetical protein